ncbi:MAG: glycosyltransferase family 1 protein [Patescibacteria group bacterium]
MRIAIDGSTICDRSGGFGAGIEHYTWSMIFSMLHCDSGHDFYIQVPDYFPRHLEHELLSGKAVGKISRMPKRIPFISHHVLYPLWLKMKKIDVLFCPYGQMPFMCSTKTVVTIHDASIYEHPDWFPESASGHISAKYIVPQTIKRADALIAVSNATKDQLLRVFPEIEKEIFVVHEGVDLPNKIDDACLKKFNLVQNTILFIGTVEPRKNLVKAIGAFDRFLDSKPDNRLTTKFVIAGKMGWKTDEIQNKLLEVNGKWKAQVGHSVVSYVGVVSEAEKWALVSCADILFYPSQEEGFGLPVLEAMACYTPVICSSKGALAEIGGDAVMYVNPDDEDQMSLAIAQCLLVPEGTRLLRDAGIKRAKQFTWQKSAKQTLEIIEGLKS